MPSLKAKIKDVFGEPAESIQIGDLGDFQNLAGGADLLVTHSHGRQAAEHLAFLSCASASRYLIVSAANTSSQFCIGVRAT